MAGPDAHYESESSADVESSGSFDEASLALALVKDAAAAGSGAAGNGNGSAGGASTTEALLRELIELQRSQAREAARRLEVSGKLERLQRRQANRQRFASSVAEALGVVCALLASTMLSSLVYPPDVVYDPEIWSGLGGLHSACYTPSLEGCRDWQAVYGVSASVAFVLVMVALLMTVEVYMGRTHWLHRALVVFFTGVQMSAVTIISSFWLSQPLDLAVFSVVAMTAFILISMLLLPSVLTWIFYQLPVVGGRALMMEKLRSEKYAGTLLANIPDTQGGVTPLHLVTYVLLGQQDSNEAEPRSDSPLRRLVRFSFESWLRLLVLAEEEVPVAGPDTSTVPPLLLVAFLGDERWASIMLNAGADPDCELVDSTGLYFPLYVAARAGHSRVVDCLLRFDADPHKVDAAGQNALHAGAWGGNLEVVKALLRAGVNPRAVDKGGRSPLHWAAERGHIDAAKTLLKKGADPRAADTNGRTPLHLAAIVGQRQVVKALLRAGADCNAKALDGWTPLHAAASGGSAGVAMALLKAGAEVTALSDTGATPLHEAAEKGHARVAAALLSAGSNSRTFDSAGATPLHAAALAGSLPVVEVLLAAGADPNASQGGWTPLQAGAVGGNREVVEALLEAGANAAGDEGWTPLLAAAWGGSLDVVQALLGAGVDPRAFDRDGRSSLHAAAWGGNDLVLRALLRAGGDPNTQDSDGRTPLHQAAAGGHTQVVEALLEAGADPQLTDKQGRKALDDALEAGHSQLEPLLVAGAPAAATRSGTRSTATVGALPGPVVGGGRQGQRLGAWLPQRPLAGPGRRGIGFAMAAAFAALPPPTLPRRMYTRGQRVMAVRQQALSLQQQPCLARVL